jgi:hypothetical protein
MSDKASSDLDVFDGLAAKKSRPSGPPLPSSRAPAPPPSSVARQKTLLGLAAPPIPGSRPAGAPPPPPSTSKGPVPPPPQARASAPPPGRPSAPAGFPAPPPPPGSGAPPPPPPSAAASPPALPSLGAAPQPPLGSPPAPPPPPAALSATLPAAPTPPAPPPPPAGLGALPLDDDKTVNRAPVGPPGKGVDIDWDDEDEQTTVFDKGIEDTARALLHSAPPPPPPGIGPMSRLPTPPPAAGAPPPAARAAAALVSRPLSVPPPPTPSKAPPPPVPSKAPLPPPPKTGPISAPPALAPAPAPRAPAPAMAAPVFDIPAPPQRRGLFIAVVAVLVVAVAAAAFLLVPSKGSLVVTVAGPGNKAIESVQIFVDNQKKCEASPCQVLDLDKGIHLVKVTAPGYQSTAPAAVKISPGDEAAHNIVLTPSGDGSGVKVTAEGAGLKLSVNGQDKGPLPQDLELAPGDYTLSIDGGERYESWEKRVTVEADKKLTIEPKLKVKKGLATIKAGDNADDARVLLVSGSERRPIPQLPIKVDINVDKPYKIVASKKGFQDFETSVSFEDGQAERTFIVDLQPAASEPAAGGGASRVAAAAPAAIKSPPAEKPSADAGKAKLNLNSIPVSNVILDGRPLGPTPKAGIAVSPGSHNVIFVHAEHGRKAKSVTVEAGKTATVSVRFP